MTSQKSYRVPAGRVVGLADLRTKMATANDLAYHLALTSDPGEFQVVMEALHAAYWIAAALAKRSTRTGCAEHPHGPVDPEAPDGWGQCLLCNSRRRSGRARRALRMVGNGENLTGATSQVNRPQRSLNASMRPAEANASRWREPEEVHTTQPYSPILAHRQAAADSEKTHAAALARARREKAERAAGQPARPSGH
ncbi:hypothetical protein [Kitasatospora aureofaciens]|uniref:hypothetical protein n=1 Tax=Kitasatospora aureofaciens TaxID=1894 RepID=UPI0033CBF271